MPPPPDELEVVPPLELGALAAPLVRLAEAQGAWPPVVPSQVAHAPETLSWAAGAEAADRLVDGGADLVVVAGGGERGPALALLAVLLHLEPVAAVGTASTPGWGALVATVRDGLRVSRPYLGNPDALVESVDALRIAGLAGVMNQAAVRRTPTLLSGAADAVAAAVLAERVTPGTVRWLIAGCSSPAGAGRTGLTELGLEPLLDLRLPGPEGADLALDLLRSAVGLVRA
jgi:nicotinate-nucleotide--dimethylbenzimidazole phosphoribosyltransferase